MISSSLRGVEINASTATQIQGNYIGTDPSGTAARPNTGEGIFVANGSPDTLIGGSTLFPGVAPGNLISGNGTGVEMNGGSTNTVLNANAIGPTSGGATGIGNGTGVRVLDTSTASVGENNQNLIAHNLGDGIEVLTTTGRATVWGNEIHSNGGLGIDLGNGGLNGVTPNDPGDVDDNDDGPNNLQNFPVITSIVWNPGLTAHDVNFTLDTNDDGDYLISLFSSPSCDPSGNGEGADWRATPAPYHHFGGGVQAFSYPLGSLTAGHWITATATSYGGGTTSYDTSEFSACFQVPAAPGQTFTVNSTADPGDGTCDGTECTLREAIVAANAVPGTPDTIEFAIPPVGSLAEITIAGGFGGLPTITDAVTIDGTTQGTGPFGEPRVDIDVGDAESSDGLEVSGIGASGTEILGLAIHHSPEGSGIAIRNGADSVVIQGNYLGSDSTGTFDFGNSLDGVFVAAGSDDTTIGGSGVGEGNLIIGNNRNGITDAGTGTSIAGNLIGTNASNQIELYNGSRGIQLNGTGTDVGGSPDGRNVISAHPNHGIFIRDAANVDVEYNYIGTTVDGESVFGNGTGVQIEGSSTDVDVGRNDGGGNVISGNAVGVAVSEATTSNINILGNLIGTDQDGAEPLGNTSVGIDVDLGASGVQIGSSSGGNVISGNGAGIEITGGANSAVIVGNRIGTDIDGLADLGNTGNGIYVEGVTGTAIGGATAGVRNVISGNGAGVVLQTATNTAVMGNYIGADATGNAALPNSNQGIFIGGTTTGTQVGGAAATPGAAPGNVISGNDFSGVTLNGSETANNTLRGNAIGVGAAGAPLPNAQYGVTLVSGAHDNVVGNATGTGSDLNAIAFNPNANVQVIASSDNTILGNRIGTADGTTAPAANGDGVRIEGASTGNVVGGTQPNVISGHNSPSGIGVNINGSGTTGNVVQGNRIGTNDAADASLPNTYGVVISGGASGNVVGKRPPSLGGTGPGNLIAGNDDVGILITSPTTANNHVRANLIGLAGIATSTGIRIDTGAHGNVVGYDADAGEPANGANQIIESDDVNVHISGANDNQILGNTIQDALEQGVFMDANASANEIRGNHISNNGSTSTGISIGSGSGNRISKNSIHDNLGLGIDLVDAADPPDGVTPNDECVEEFDCDTGGPNELMNHPTLTSAVAAGGTTTVSGAISVPPSLSGTPQYTVEIFSSPTCDGSLHGEGETYLDAVSGILMNDTSSGTPEPFTANIAQAVPLGHVITATVTDEFGNTSEFSACEAVTAGGPDTSELSTFGADEPTSLAGAEKIPLDDPNLATLVRGGTTSTTQGSALDSIALDSIPLEELALDSIALDSIALDSIGLTPELLRQALGGVHLADIPLLSGPSWDERLVDTRFEGAPLTAVTLADVFELPSPPIQGIALDSIDLSGTALDSIGLAALAIGPLALDSIPLDGNTAETAANRAAWCAAMQQQGLTCTTTDLEGPGGTTLIEATLKGLALDSIALDSIPLDSIDLTGTALDSIALDSIDLTGTALDSIALDSIPLDSIGLTGTALDSIALDSIDVTGTALDSIALDSIDVTGTALDSIALDSIDVTGTALDSIALDSIDITGTALDSIPLDSIALDSIDDIVDCSDNWCAGKTLGDAVGADRLQPGAQLGQLIAGLGPTSGATLGQLIAALEGLGVQLGDILDSLQPGSAATIADLLAALPPGSGATLDDLIDSLPTNSGADIGDLIALIEDLPSNPTLGDLLAVLLATAEPSYDWGRLPLSEVPIQDFTAPVPGDPERGVITYRANFRLDGGAGGPFPATLEATLPDDARYKAGSGLLINTSAETSVPVEPQQSAGSLKLTWNVLPEVGDSYQLVFKVRPGLELKPFPAQLNLEVPSLPDQEVDAAPVEILQTLEAPTEAPADAVPLEKNALYFGHIVRADFDYLRVPIPAQYGARTIVDLTHLRADYDLVVFGPGNPDRASAEITPIPIGNEPLVDSAVPLSDQTQELPPETLEDVDVAPIAGATLRATSANRGTAPEHLELISYGEPGDYIIRIDPYEDAESTHPYAIRITQQDPPLLPDCPTQRTFPFPTAGTPGTAPAIPPGTTLNTLFLVNRERLGKTYGATAATNVMNSLATLASRADIGVTSAILPVESSPSVALAYAAWDGNQCSPRLAHKTALAISAYVQSFLASRGQAQVDNVVVVGGDDIIPFARVPDETEIANERGYAQSLGADNNQFLGSAANGFMLTDDIYGDRDPKEWFGRDLFVPDRALGRLVETPGQITAQVTQFINRQGRITPSASLVTGYNFLTDGAQAVNSSFPAAGRQTLINNTWDRQALLNALFPAAGPQPQVDSINAHFDHNRLLPASLDNPQVTFDARGELFTAADLASGNLDGRLLFTMGCHSGYAAANAIFGTAVAAENPLAADFAETAAADGAVAYVAETTYGLGDTVIVAYSERLHALFAEALHGRTPLLPGRSLEAPTTGRALVAAKQQYLGPASGTVLTPYDEKVSIGVVHYGLPMYRYGPDQPTTPPADPLPISTDPATGLQSASLSVSPNLEKVSTANGDYYRVVGEGSGGVEVTPRRPIQPLSIRDVTQPASVGLAHGAIIESLTSLPDEQNFDAAWSRVEVDSSLRGPELVGEGSSGTKLQAITTIDLPGGSLHQQLLLVAGHFRSDGQLDDEGIGIQTLYTQQQVKVYYASAAATDFTPPTFNPVEVLRVGSTVGFAVDVTDNAGASAVKRVLALYQDCNGQWRRAELAKGAGSRWSGGGTVATACNDLSYLLQAVDSAGNVAVHWRKLTDATITQPDVDPQPDPTALNATVAGTQHASGWYTSSVQVTLSSTPAGADIEYSLDGAAYQPYSSAIPISANGVHVLEFRAPDGSDGVRVIAIDTTAPTIDITTPGAGAKYFLNSNVAAQYACPDAGAGVATCAGPVPSGQPINTTSVGTKSFQVTATDAVGNPATKTVTYEVVRGSAEPIVFASNRTGGGDIYVRSALGGDPVQLTSGPAVDSEPEWTPDNRIVFSSNRDGNFELYVMNANGTHVTRLTNNPGIDTQPAASPNGLRIAFASNRGGNWDIYVMNIDGSNLQRLTTNGTVDQLPAWSPSSQEIAFFTERSGQGDIYKMPATPNGKETRLTSGNDGNSLDTEPAWFGSTIAFTTARHGANNLEIYTMNTNGGALSRRTNSAGHDVTPTWSPEGSAILFASNRAPGGGANYDLYTMPGASVGPATALVMHPAADITPDW